MHRRTYLSDGERLENDAEHAWHMAVMALLLSDYSNEKVDVLKVVSLLLIHDLVEIYAGDTFAYDEEGQKTQRERELAAAERLFSQLPLELAMKMRSLWDEFEEWGSAESKFAHTPDNFQPMLLQHASGGRSWREGVANSPRCSSGIPEQPKVHPLCGNMPARISFSLRLKPETSGMTLSSRNLHIRQ